jgi:hypothetical protein
MVSSQRCVFNLNQLKNYVPSIKFYKFQMKLPLSLLKTAINHPMVCYAFVILFFLNIQFVYILFSVRTIIVFNRNP